MLYVHVCRLDRLLCARSLKFAKHANDAVVSYGSRYTVTGEAKNIVYLRTDELS